MTDVERLDEIADRLDAIEEELRDLAYDRLATAARDPDSDDGRAAATGEKRLNQARRAPSRRPPPLSVPNLRGGR